MTQHDPGQVDTATQDSAQVAVSAHTQQALERIKAACSRRKEDEAVRFFKDALSHGLIPDDETMLPWLRQTLGNEPTDKLLNAYAKLSCFFCERGLIACEDCNGRGHDEEGMLCTGCLALGIDRCDFCGGSGWFTINHVHRALQLPVILRRVVAASKEADILFGSPASGLSTSTGTETRKQAAKALLQVNRILGVLENMAVAARQLESRQTEEVESVRKAIAACEALAPRLGERACQILGILAEAAKIEATSVSRTTARRVAERRAEFYGELATTRNFSGTFLRHPFLFHDQQCASPPPEQPG